MDNEFISMLKYIHLNGLLANWDHYLKLARDKNYSHIRFLKYVIEQEYSIKKENSRKTRLNRAKIQERYVMETFPFKKQPKLNKKKILSIYDSLDYMRENQNIIWIGPTGSGKSGLATAHLIQAINNGYSGRFILFPDLIETLYKSRGDHSEGEVIKKFSSYDCLLIDELCKALHNSSYDKLNVM